MIRSCISPDGVYLLSGSEDGSPVLWDIASNKRFDDEIERMCVKFKGPVIDVDWNNKYHMIAVCGFGAEFPILVYVCEHEGIGVNLKKE